ncbi:MAG: PA2779 family protein [Acidobacteriota bacterium]|nr:PA2779 family protein [Acidobacteriota bacterium]
MLKRSFILFVALAVLSMPTFAAPMPSKAIANQSLDARAADLTVVRDAAANAQVASVLASHGFSQEQVNQRLAQLSNQDLHQLAQNLNQLQAAGLTRQEWIYVLIGAVAVLLIIVLATK